MERCAEIVSIAAGYLEEDFACDPLLQGGAYRYILLGFLDVRDVCIMLIDLRDMVPSTGDNAMLQVLAKKKIYPYWLADELNQNIGFVYRQQSIDFLELDAAVLYDKLDQIVSDFRHFKKYVLEYLK